MTVHFVTRKHWTLASALLICGSLAGYGLGQQVAHVRQMTRSHIAYYQVARVASVAGAIGGQAITVTRSAPSHHSDNGRGHTPVRLPAARQHPHPRPTRPPAQPTAVVIQVSGPVHISVSPTPSCPPGPPAPSAGDGSGNAKDDGLPKACRRRDSGHKHDKGAEAQPGRHVSRAHGGAGGRRDARDAQGTLMEHAHGKPAER